MKKILAFLLTLVLTVTLAASAFAYDVNTAKNSVVRIVTFYTITDPNYPSLVGEVHVSLGSGFAIGMPGEKIRYIATAGHVVCHYPGANYAEETTEIVINGQPVQIQVHVDEIHVLVSDISNYILANVEKASPQADVAVLKLVNDTLPREAAVVWDRKDFGINEQLTSMGFPYASEGNLASEIQGQLLSDVTNITTNTGSFSAWRGQAETREGDQISTTAEMSPGISGGPLVDSQGYVVGVCDAVSTLTDNSNYAVASDELLLLMSSISELRYPAAPLKEGISTTTIIIIAAAVVLAALLVALLIAGSKGKKNKRTLVLTGSMAGKTLELKKGVPVVVGRDPNRCQIVYPKDTAGVSSVHCTITFDGNQVTVADNGSSYGTFVGGGKVEPGKPVVMHRGQEMYFGSDKNKAELH